MDKAEAVVKRRQFIILSLNNAFSILGKAFKNEKNGRQVWKKRKNKASRKMCRPSVTVKDSKGKMLKNNMDYTVLFPKKAKNVRKYVWTVMKAKNIVAKK